MIEENEKSGINFTEASLPGISSFPDFLLNGLHFINKQVMSLSWILSLNKSIL